ncbi:MAG: hypothetical protein ING36_13355, partial [Burkholderiales bacterium]|nr:hypothetical protein [Burkholderiales bacterium]
MTNTQTAVPGANDNGNTGRVWVGKNVDEVVHELRSRGENYSVQQVRDLTVVMDSRGVIQGAWTQQSIMETTTQRVYQIMRGTNMSYEQAEQVYFDRTGRARDDLNQRLSESGGSPVVPPLETSLDTTAHSGNTSRPDSYTFVTQADANYVTLQPGGTVSDIVLLQNRAGNPISADDVRAANPELNINDRFSNVPAGVTLQVPVRVGDYLVTTIPGGGTQSVNTKTQEITTVIPNQDGSTTQTTSMTDGEFTRTVRSITYDDNGEIQTEQHYRINTLDNTRTPVNEQDLNANPEISPLDLSQGLQVADASAYADSASDVMVSDDPETDTPYTSDDTNLQATQV